MSDPAEVVITQRQGPVLTVTMNRPKVLNVLDEAMADALVAAFSGLAADQTIRAVILAGAGRSFMAGGDLSRFQADLPGAPQTATLLIDRFHTLMRLIKAMPQPVIAAVQGPVAGGGVGLALAGDIVFAARSAYFVQVFGPKLGLVPDVGVTWYTPRLVGRARARALALLGDRLPAEKAAEWGLIWEAVDDDKLLETARATAARLAKGPRAGFAKIKEVLDASLDNTLEQQLDLERVTQGELGDDPDFREGVLAFLQKRDPVFR